MIFSVCCKIHFLNLGIILIEIMGRSGKFGMYFMADFRTIFVSFHKNF